LQADSKELSIHKNHLNNIGMYLTKERQWFCRRSNCTIYAQNWTLNWAPKKES